MPDQKDDKGFLGDLSSESCMKLDQFIDLTSKTNNWRGINDF